MFNDLLSWIMGFEQILCLEEELDTSKRKLTMINVLISLKRQDTLQ